MYRASRVRDTQLRFFISRYDSDIGVAYAGGFPNRFHSVRLKRDETIIYNYNYHLSGSYFHADDKSIDAECDEGVKLVAVTWFYYARYGRTKIYVISEPIKIYII